jgi:hypothetical protein
MAKAALAGLFLVHGMIANRVSSAAAHTELEWHSHPIPNAAYIVSGEPTLERKKDGKKLHFAAGQAVSETVGTFQRGMAGNEPVVLIVFYAGSAGVPLIEYPCRSIGSCQRMKPLPGEPHLLKRPR